jgi:hypothetical protein
VRRRSPSAIVRGVPGTVASAILVAAATACGSSGGASDPSAAAQPTADGGSEASPAAQGSKDASPDGNTPADPGPAPVIYANEIDGNTLFKFDPVSNALSVVGHFAGATGCQHGIIEDIAIDRDLHAFAVGQAGRYPFNLGSAACEQPTGGGGSSAVALGFVPASGQASDTLVGFQHGIGAPEYFSLDAYGQEVWITLPPSRFKTGLNALSSTSGGDIVTTSEGRTFATTVTDTDSSLFELDPKTGAVITDYGELGVARVNGLASWGPTLYGFTGKGKVITFLPAKSSMKVIVLAQTNNRFGGAASVVPRSQ